MSRVELSGEKTLHFQSKCGSAVLRLKTCAREEKAAWMCSVSWAVQGTGPNS